MTEKAQIRRGRAAERGVKDFPTEAGEEIAAGGRRGPVAPRHVAARAAAAVGKDAVIGRQT
ncbi:hypothetical protein [Streptomyces sp. enrichment culture]|uniref:hypothetical protein n=1 Tax=Streptomyces sp. enrichment culture TaxID=1795815 RepID=UPI003F547241